MTVNKIKDTIINEAMYQTGGLPGHAVEEHVFPLKSIIVMREELGKGTIFMILDIMSKTWNHPLTT